MATSTGEESAAAAKVEGAELLGKPKFKKLENGRFRCVQTGHEVLAKDKDSYSRTKRCRLGLIDFALSRGKAPLNMFDQDPLSRSKLKCKLTGDTINKTEEHIWKHINGKRFLNKLEQEELEKGLMDKPGDNQQAKKKAAEASKPSPENSKKKKQEKKKKKMKEEKKTISEARESNGQSDPEDAFWMPPVGQRWDCDDGGDRWGSGSDSEHESDEVIAMDDEDKDKHGENESDEDKHGENESDEDKHGENESDEDKHGENKLDEDKHDENQSDEDKHGENKSDEDKHGENESDEDKHGENKLDEDKHDENQSDEDKHGENKSDEDKHGENESAELSQKLKRMSTEIGPCSCASRKKSKKSSA